MVGRLISEDVMIKIIEQLVHELSPSETKAAEIVARVKRFIPQFIDLAESRGQAGTDTNNRGQQDSQARGHTLEHVPYQTPLPRPQAAHVSTPHRQTLDAPQKPAPPPRHPSQNSQPRTGSIVLPALPAGGRGRGVAGGSTISWSESPEKKRGRSAAGSEEKCRNGKTAKSVPSSAARKPKKVATARRPTVKDKRKTRPKLSLNHLFIKYGSYCLPTDLRQQFMATVPGPNRITALHHFRRTLPDSLIDSFNNTYRDVASVLNGRPLDIKGDTAQQMMLAHNESHNISLHTAFKGFKGWLQKDYLQACQAAAVAAAAPTNGTYISPGSAIYLDESSSDNDSSSGSDRC